MSGRSDGYGGTRGDDPNVEDGEESTQDSWDDPGNDPEENGCGGCRIVLFIIVILAVLALLILRCLGKL